MGFFDDLKFKREANKEFKEQVGHVKADIARHMVAEQQAKQKPRDGRIQGVQPSFEHVSLMERIASAEARRIAPITSVHAERDARQR